MSRIKNISKAVSEPYSPPESLWQLIKAVAEDTEQDAIKSRIGTSLIETNIDLHNEIDSLLEIWRDYRNETNENLNRGGGKISSFMPEPPNIRETIKKEINFFVKQMREQYKTEATFCRQIINNKHNLNVINYVLNTASSTSGDPTVYDLKSERNESARAGFCERPRSTLDKYGVETPVMLSIQHAADKHSEESDSRMSRQSIRYRPVSRSGSRMGQSSMSTITNDLQGLTTFTEGLEEVVDEDKLNFYQIDEVVDHLQELLQKESDTMLKDIEFLYNCIDNESDYRLSSEQKTNKEPTLNELKEERKLLETDLMSSHSKNQAKISKLPSNLSSARSNRSIMSPIGSPVPSSTCASSIVSVNAIEVKDFKKSDSKDHFFLKVEKNPIAARSTKLQSNKALTGSANKLNNSLMKSPSSLVSEIMDKKKVLANKTLSSNRPIEKSQTQPKTRSDSVSSASSRTSYSSQASSVSLSRTSSVQKFRKMVSDYRE